ncbi:InlB B-repeat-containing protein [Anaerostipes sp.]|uniref:InlB B-repeat-containing protein n=1 Tax=Anaerostipes sp. TaxID=1872530 RepID=UPI0025C45C43|nr:InlB B-repeat-containing protein [Anaerostipes sp.]MBS7008928.1 InlB B-repeat-containing protein [Anaerostipes sp.]
MEDSLNEKGYWITGTTKTYNLVVEPGVTTAITLDNVDITVDIKKLDCINVSHANVVLTLVGKNHLYSQAGGAGIYENGNALTKDGMDGSLTLQCEEADNKGHRCDENCGTLLANGDTTKRHAGAIGGTYRVAINPDTKPIETGFVNFTIKGGNIEAFGGSHCPGIGAACRAQEKGGYTKNIEISGGNVKAIGTEYGSGIGSGMGTKVDGIKITGGTVTATGGQYAPGIGASATGASFVSFQTQETQNVVISGGDTVVTAIGDSGTNMPGIGSGGGNSKVTNVTASPDTGYQGYIQDGTSLSDYTFMDGTPFSKETDIKVGRFYTKVYFGPFRDANDIDKTSKEQIGANHLISKSGGEPFTEEQLKQLTKVTGKQESGEYFPSSQLSIADQKQLDAINEAKMKGQIGDFPLTYTTENGTKATVTISLRTDGTDAAKMDPEKPTSMIGANDFREETGGDPFGEEEIKKLGELKGKDPDGNNIPLGNYLLNTEQYQKINDAKTAGKVGVFPLTYETADGKKAVINVTLVKYDQAAENPDNGEILKGKDVISKTGGSAFEEEQLKALTNPQILDADGNKLPKEQISIADSSQVQKINEAKTSGSTGEFPLTLKTDGGTEVTVTVFLKDEGSDGAKYDPQDPDPSIGADDAEHETGGNPFSEEEIIKLCKALGKNSNGDTIDIFADKTQLQNLNAAKQAAKTGVFSMTFSMEDGTKVQVKVTLTGKHKVNFDPNGGDYTPEIQTPEGGSTLVRPKEPKKDGYDFVGWFYTDENGKEREWDFKDPVNQNMTLKAKWKKTDNHTSSEQKNQGGDSGRSGDKESGTKNLPGWDYSKRGGSSSDGKLAKTSDTKPLYAMMGLSAAALLGILFAAKKKRIHR